MSEPYNPDPAEIRRVKQETEERLLAIPGVNIVALGGKTTGGRETGELVIQVWVDVKRPLEDIPPEERIPAEIDGVKTDVYVGGDIVLVVDPPKGGLVRDGSMDDYRPRPALVGGVKCQAEGGPGEGTLGCFVSDPADVSIAYGLTNQHVFRLTGITDPNTKMGQPSNSSSTCCNDIIGTYGGGSRIVTPQDGTARDEALIKLLPGTQFLAQVAEIGYISGSKTVLDTEVHDPANPYLVRKRGARTRLTGGKVISVQGSTAANPDNLIIVEPSDNPGRGPGEPLFFDAEGDSGSVLIRTVREGVEDKHYVVGLVYARSSTRAELLAKGVPASSLPPLPADGIERVKGYVLPIAKILKRFADIENVDVVVSTASALDQVHTVPGGTTVAVPEEMAARLAGDPAFVGGTGGDGRVRAPLARSWYAQGRPPDELLAAFRAQLAATAVGRQLLAFWDTHQDELLRLVRTDRRVTIAWHRGGGAAVLQYLLRMITRPELVLPETIDGVPVLDCAHRFADVLAARGGTALATDLEPLRAAVPDIGGRTLAEIMIALGAVPEEAGHA
ncbi:MAG: hypothetical protein GEV11_12530 [Streptosporangiales bacterium]|nr:hypothetical protein [Streptosporangiales bacterium]